MICYVMVYCVLVFCGMFVILISTRVINPKGGAGGGPKREGGKLSKLRQISKQSKRKQAKASKQASKQASERASERSKKKRSKEAKKQRSKQATTGGGVLMGWVGDSS